MFLFYYKNLNYKEEQMKKIVLFGLVLFFSCVDLSATVKDGVDFIGMFEQIRSLNESQDLLNESSHDSFDSEIDNIQVDDIDMDKKISNVPLWLVKIGTYVLVKYVDAQEFLKKYAHKINFLKKNEEK